MGWRYLVQHLDVLLPPELLNAIDPLPFGNHAIQEGQGCFTNRGYLTLSGDECEHERPREKQPEKKSSIWEWMDDAKRECAERKDPDNPSPQKKPPRDGRPMSRSKKWRLEWLLFLGENGRLQYNKLCKGCVHPCRQSFRAVVLSCPHYLSLCSQKYGN